MARYRGPVEKLERRFGVSLNLKGERRLAGKSALDKRPYGPGQHGQRRSKISEYGLQLREKQKAKFFYGVTEKQFRNLFREANRKSGNTGENLIQLLETRLDNVVFRMGFAMSRSQARQLIRHRHVEVNGRLVDIPSFRVSAGDEIAIKPKSKEILPIQESLEARTRPTLLEWLALDEKARVGRMIRQPTRGDIPLAAQEQLIVELYSK